MGLYASWGRISEVQQEPPGCCRKQGSSWKVGRVGSISFAPKLQPSWICFCFPGSAPQARSGIYYTAWLKGPCKSRFCDRHENHHFCIFCPTQKCKPMKIGHFPLAHYADSKPGFENEVEMTRRAGAPELLVKLMALEGSAILCREAGAP